MEYIQDKVETKRCGKEWVNIIKTKEAFLLVPFTRPIWQTYHGSNLPCFIIGGHNLTNIKYINNPVIKTPRQGSK